MDRLLRFSIRSIEALILIGLIVIAAYVSMGRLLVANLQTVSGTVQQVLSENLNLPLTFTGLSGEWRYMDPVFYFTDVQLADAATIRDVEVRVDTLSSLMAGKLVVSDLLVDGVWARITVTENGQLLMSGLEGRGGGEFTAEPIHHVLEHLAHLSLRDVLLEVDHRDVLHRVTISGNDPAEIYLQENRKIVRIPLTFSDGQHTGQTLLMAEYSGNMRSPDDIIGKAYFEISDIRVPEIRIAELRMAPLLVDGQFWLSQDNTGLSLVGEPVVRDVTVTLGQAQLETIDRMSFLMHGRGSDMTDMSVELPLMDIDVGDRSWHAEQLGLAWRGNRVAGVIPQVSIDDVIELTQEVSTLPVAVSEVLELVRPRGQLQDVHFVVPLDSVADSRSTFRLKSVSSRSYRGMPGFSGISGFADLGLREGTFDLHEEDLVVEFGELFPESWSFNSARGRFQYVYQQGYLQVSSGLLLAETDDIRASGRMHLNLPPELENRTWGLELGITGTPVTEIPRYVPDTVDQQARDWLRTALTAGVATESGMVFHGAIAKPVPNIRKSHDLFVRLQGLDMRYAPEWPPLTNIDAEVHVSTRGVRSRDATGQLYDNIRVHGTAFMPLQYNQAAKTIDVTGTFEGSAGEGIRLLNESPLSELTRNVTADWDGEGRISGDLTLTVPLVSDADDQLDADVRVNLDTVRLSMRAWDLDATDLRGQVHYLNNEGLFAKHLLGELWGRPARIDIETVGDQMTVTAQGEVDMISLHEWTGQSLLTRLAGVTPYHASVHVPLDDEEKDGNIHIEATSDLTGITVDMPAPMTKAENEPMRFSYRQEFGEQHDYIDLALGDQVRGWIQSTDGAISGGHLVFGDDKPPLVSYDTFLVTGTLERADYDEWQRFTTALDEVSEYALESELISVLQSIDLNIGLLTGVGPDLTDVHTMIGRGSDRWMVHLSNQELAGLVEVPDDESERLIVNLDFMRYESGQPAGDVWVDPMAGITADEFVPLRFSTGSLTYDGEDYGRWSFDLDPVDDVIKFTNLEAEVRGLSIGNGAEMTWHPGEPGKSRFSGEVVVANLAETLEAWGYAASIEGRDFMFRTNLTWAGSPTMIDMLLVDGDVELTSGTGRFVQAESADALKLLGIFDFTALARRFRFDFSDVVSQGMTFSNISGVTRLKGGHVQIVEPIVIEASGSTFTVGGSVNLHQETLDNDMIVTLPLSKNLPWYAAYSTIATGPIAGAGVLLVQQIFSDQLDTISSSKFRITGTIDDPVVEFDSIFDRRVRRGEQGPDSTVRDAIGAEEPLEDTERKASEAQGLPGD